MKRIVGFVGVMALVCMAAGTAMAADSGMFFADGKELNAGSEQVQESTLDGASGPQYSSIFQIGDIKSPGKGLSPEEVLLTYFEDLYSACNLPEDNQVPISGTIGTFKEPYPAAYACWSKAWQQKNSYEEYLDSWENTANVELLKLIPAGEEDGQKKFFVETRNMEAIQDSNNPRMGVFCYKGYFTVANTAEGWRITGADMGPEDPSWYIAGHQSWYAEPEAVAQVIGLGIGLDTDLGSPVVENNGDGSITVRFQDKNGKDTSRVVLVQAQDRICQVISTEKVADK